MEDRLNMLLEYEQLSPSRFADLIGVQRSSVSHILSGRNKPSFDFLQKILKAFPELRADWLIQGKGEMYPDQARRNLDLFGPESVVEQERPEAEETKATATGTAEAKTAAMDTGFLKTSGGKRITQVMVFYEDRTFTTHFPDES